MLLINLFCLFFLLSKNLIADEVHFADSHGPITVMGDHMHRAGEWMASYRYMSMDMSGNTDGRNGLSDEEIATTVLNRFSNIAGQPGTLRVVPQNMEMDMHMFGFMYAPSNDITSAVAM